MENNSKILCKKPPDQSFASLFYLPATGAESPRVKIWHFPTWTIINSSSDWCWGEMRVRHVRMSAGRLQEERQVLLRPTQECWFFFSFCCRRRSFSCYTRAELTHRHSTVCPCKEWSIRKNDGGRRGVGSRCMKCVSVRAGQALLLCFVFGHLLSSFAAVPFISSRQMCFCVFCTCTVGVLSSGVPGALTFVNLCQHSSDTVTLLTVCVFFSDKIIVFYTFNKNSCQTGKRKSFWPKSIHSLRPLSSWFYGATMTTWKSVWASPNISVWLLQQRHTCSVTETQILTY